MKIETLILDILIYNIHHREPYRLYIDCRKLHDCTSKPFQLGIIAWSNKTEALPDYFERPYKTLGAWPFSAHTLPCFLKELLRSHALDIPVMHVFIHSKKHQDSLLSKHTTQLHRQFTALSDLSDHILSINQSFCRYIYRHINCWHKT